MLLRFSVCTNTMEFKTMLTVTFEKRVGADRRLAATRTLQCQPIKNVEHFMEMFTAIEKEKQKFIAKNTPRNSKAALLPKVDAGLSAPSKSNREKTVSNDGVGDLQSSLEETRISKKKVVDAETSSKFRLPNLDGRGKQIASVDDRSHGKITDNVNGTQRRTLPDQYKVPSVSVASKHTHSKPSNSRT